jgi:hypothetical protein
LRAVFESRFALFRLRSFEALVPLFPAIAVLPGTSTSRRARQFPTGLLPVPPAGDGNPVSALAAVLEFPYHAGEPFRLLAHS